MLLLWREEHVRQRWVQRRSRRSRAVVAGLSYPCVSGLLEAGREGGRGFCCGEGWGGGRLGSVSVSVSFDVDVDVDVAGDRRGPG